MLLSPNYFRSVALINNCSVALPEVDGTMGRNRWFSYVRRVGFSAAGSFTGRPRTPSLN